ncbi:hypothetical protein M0Q50_10685 [bacterium]|jgi:hypothetical protein|nr:hypothetical protein [bacterium]
MITKFKLFESLIDITIPDVAWLYFLHYAYKGKMEIKNWEKDKRMDGANFRTSLEKFDCVKDDGKYFTTTDDCITIIDKYFGTKKFEKSVQMKYDLLEYDDKTNKNTWERTYEISKIPYELFLKKNQSIEKSFDRIGDMIVKHFNSQVSSRQILEKMSKMRHMDKYNYKSAMDHFKGNIPEKFNIYRGLKDEYDSSVKSDYSCWTTDYKQAERFAKYRFTGGMQFKPIISEKHFVLVSVATLNDISVFISGEESEVIMKGEVNVDKIINLLDYNETKS